MKEGNAIELKGVSLSYQVEILDNNKNKLLGIFPKKKIENKVLDDINLEIKKGEILGIVGVNGSGKSTILSIISKIMEPDTGIVETSGKVAAILELGMGFHPDMSGRENILLKGELYGFSKTEIESRMEEIIEYSGIRSYIDNPVRTYSSGMKSRLAFSIMINVNADIMIVDEILSTGDSAFSSKASDYFKKILKDGKTVVYVSHSQSSIESICTRVIWLDKGKIRADGPARKICHVYNEALMSSFEIIYDQAESGLADAQYKLAHFYRDGGEIEKNLQLYELWLEKSAEQGHADAQAELAGILNEKGGTEDRKKAIEYLRASAMKRNPLARTKLSELMGDGEYEHNVSELDHIFKQISDLGNPGDMMRYADFLFNISPNESSKSDALQLYLKLSEEFNHPDAIMQAANIYFRGLGVHKDFAKYVELLEKAANLGVTRACLMLADIYMDGYLVEKDEQTAFKFYLAGAKKGFDLCQYQVALMYLDGIGVEKNPHEAMKWFDCYLETHLIRYHMAAFGLVEDCIDTETTHQKIIDIMKQTYDPNALMFICEQYRNNPSIKLDETEVEHMYSIMSEMYGRPLNIAIDHYKRRDSNSYNPELSLNLNLKRVHTGNPDILLETYKQAASLNSPQYEKQAIKYLELATLKGNKEAKFLLKNREN